jgi:formate dehydrogenase beta subunit
VIVAKLIDTTSCIGCKACEAACQEWNDQGLKVGVARSDDGTYQTLPDLRHDFWNVIKFKEVTREDGSFTWLMSKYQCMHCVDAGCPEACPRPAPSSGGRTARRLRSRQMHRLRVLHHRLPFDVPKLSPVTQKVYKCTLCSDRTSVGLEPACIKACPTNCLTFGARDDLVRLADARAQALRADGKSNAGVYNPAGVGGTNVLYVLADATRPEDYGLPRDPTIPWQVRFWKGPLKWIGNAVLVGGVLGAFLHYLRYGPKEVEE